MAYESIPLDDYENLEQAVTQYFALGELIDSRSFMGAFYFATRDALGDIRATVVLTRDDADGIRLFKAISEEAGPYAICCPLSILEVLSETTNDSARSWRERCMLWNAAVVEAFVRDNYGAAGAMAVRINDSLCP